MNILITGASGSFGKRLIPALLARDAVKIRVLVHRYPVDFSELEPVKGDLEDVDSLMAATSGMDTVLHLAAVTHELREENYFKVNIEGTKNLIRACQQNKIRRLVFMSSGAAHAEGGAYSQSKLTAEQAVKESRMPWVILRPREVYGTGGPEGINQLIRWVRTFPLIPVIGDGEYSLGPVYIDDVVSATVESVFRADATRGIHTLAGPEIMSFAALIDRLAAFFAVRVGKVFLPVALVSGVASLLNGLKIKALVPDQIPRLMCDKAIPENANIESLNFHPRTLEEGLAICFPP